MLKQLKNGIVHGVGILLVIGLAGVSYAAFTGFAGLNASVDETLTATKWNDMVDAVHDEYNTDGSEILTNKTWDGKPVYRRVYSAAPQVGYITFGTISNVTPIGNWSIAGNGYRHEELAHGSSTSLSFLYNSLVGTLQVYQQGTGWNDSTFSNTTFVFEYTKN